MASRTTLSSLQWVYPGLGSLPGDTIIDNTDDGAPTHLSDQGVAVGPYDPLPPGNGISLTGGWLQRTLDDEAKFAYVPARRTRTVTLTNGSTFQVDRSLRNPQYLFTPSVPSVAGRDPRAGATQSFSWVFSPRVAVSNTNPAQTIPDPTPRAVALSLSLPVGLTTTLPNGTVFRPQRFLVVQVEYGVGQQYVEVIDRDAAGAGFVRIGGAGGPTNQVFPYAGINPSTNLPYPITVTVYNTIPRYTQGKLIGQLTDAVPTPAAVAGGAQVPAVYADAARLSFNTASSVATPTAAGFGGNDVRVIASRNVYRSELPSLNIDFLNPPDTVSDATVTSLVHNTGAPVWQYSVDETSASTYAYANGSAVYAPSPGFTPDTTLPHRGLDYLTAPARTGTPTPAPNQNVTISPDAAMPDGLYEPRLFVPGTVGALGSTVAQTLQYEVFEGAVSDGVRNLDTRGRPGFRRLGVRRYTHTSANRLRVVVYNTSPDLLDANREVVVDDILFVGGRGNAIASTPVHATALIRQTPGGNPVPTNVILVADENGRITCLDATGNANGTTNVYWTYPSTGDGQVDASGQPTFVDPNLNAGAAPNGLDGANNAIQAELPSQFDLSTAAVVRLSFPDSANPTNPPILRDYLVIGASNGRIYSIAMEGRGDQDLATGRPGTTFRRWTYPATFPTTNAPSSGLGRIASVVSNGDPTNPLIYAATEQGRIFALNAQGNAGNGGETLYNDAGLTATSRWIFPATDLLPLNPIEGAPALDVAKSRLFVGTDASDRAGRTPPRTRLRAPRARRGSSSR